MWALLKKVLTTGGLTENLCVWEMSYRHFQFVVVIGVAFSPFA